MANFFEGVGKALMHPIDEAKWMFDTTKDVVKGDMDLKDIPGSRQRLMNDITVPILGDNKIAKNSDAVAGAVIGGVLAAPAIGGMMGGAGGSSFGGFGTEGAFGNYFKPTAISKPGLGSEGVGWQGGAKLDLGVPETYSGMKEAAGSATDGFSMEKLAQVMKSIKPHDDKVPVNMVRTGGGGGRYDKSVFENPLLTREMQALYNQPLYNKLV